MVKWIGLVLALVGLSVMTSGLVSALMDLAAFLLLLFVVARKAIKRKASLERKNFRLGRQIMNLETKIELILRHKLCDKLCKEERVPNTRSSLIVVVAVVLVNEPLLVI